MNRPGISSRPVGSPTADRGRFAQSEWRSKQIRRYNPGSRELHLTGKSSEFDTQPVAVSDMRELRFLELCQKPLSLDPVPVIAPSLEVTNDAALAFDGCVAFGHMSLGECQVSQKRFSAHHKP